jgi:hypothetical protein
MAKTDALVKLLDDARDELGKLEDVARNELVRVENALNDAKSVVVSMDTGEPTVATQAPEDLADSLKKDELQAVAADAGVDVPASATKAVIAEAIVDQAPEAVPAPVAPEAPAV